MNGNQSVDSNGEKKRQVAEKFLSKFNLAVEDGSLSFGRFRSICEELFQPDEIQREEWRIQDMFGLFDQDKDGVLKAQEWRRFCDWLRVTLNPVNALLVVDVQNDFIDGSLALRKCEYKQDGAEVIQPFNYLIKNGRFDNVIYSLDWHPADHISFYENLHLRELHPDSKVTKANAKPFDKVIFADPHLEQILWPKHCVMNTWGAELHKDLVIAVDSKQVLKGTDPTIDAYSAFCDNSSKGYTELQAILQKLTVTHLYVGGLAYDVCVRATCLDGLRLGYTLAVIDDCCRGIDANNTKATKKLIAEKGGLITNSQHVLAIVNEGKQSLVMSHQSARVIALNDQNFSQSTPNEKIKKNALPCTCPNSVPE